MSNDWLSHPAVQAGLAPFIAALALVVLLRRTRFVGLAIVGAFVTLLTLTVGFSFESLTATKKMVLASLAVAAIAVILDLTGVSASRAWRGTAAAVAGAAGVWVALRVLQQQPLAAALLAGASAAAYMALLVDGMARLRGRAMRVASAAASLGLAAGASAFFGASAWLTQTGVALAAGSVSVLLAALLCRSQIAAGWVLWYPVSVTAGLVCLLAVFTGGVSAYAILPTLLVPWLFAPWRRRAASEGSRILQLD